jgi:hypothetical protein
MRQFAVVLILICGIGPVWAQQNWTPTKEDVDTFEAVVHLPDWGNSTQYPNGHIPATSEFARYYAGILSNGPRILLAEFAGTGAQQSGTHIVTTPRAFPLIADGGCHIVHIRYDIDTRQILSLECNGFA